MPGGEVTAVQQRWQNGIRVFSRAGSTEVDDQGEYRLKLPPGRYYLTADYTALGGTFSEDPGQSQMRIAAIYYPGAATIETASPIELRPGQQLAGIDFKLPTVMSYHVRGAIVPFSHASGNEFVTLRNRNSDRVRGVSGGAIAKDGSFDCGGVPPGSYWLEMLPFRVR